jgi:hypothetical protein
VKLPQWVADRLERNLADNALRYKKIQSVYLEAATALHHAGVEHIVIKGFTQSPYYVARPEYRSQSDLDLYCPPIQIATARAALKQIGYASEESLSIAAADHEYALVRPPSGCWKGNFYDPDIPLGIELHFCLWNPRVSRIDLPEIEAFWERRTVRQLDGFSFPCLCKEDHLGYLALHILRNLFLREWIVHHVYELAVFLHSHADDDAFWSSWSTLHSPALRSLELIAFYHARAWFQCRVHPSVEQELNHLPFAQLTWLERFSGSALENMFHQNKDSLWLHLSLLKSRRERWKIFKRTLVPPRIASPQAKIVRVRNKRLVHTTASQFRQYLNYLVARSVSHGAASIATLSRGLVWKISRHRSLSTYRLCLLASFFDLWLVMALIALLTATHCANLSGRRPVEWNPLL